MQHKISYIIIFVLILSFFGCSKYQKILKKADKETKYKTALELYEKGDYITCLQFLDELIPIFRGTDKSQKLYYMYPNCYYKTSDFILAAYHFKNYAKLFPNTIETEEAMYLAAYCSYLDSPKSSLDQSSTTIAMEELQLFINKYPQNPKVTTCNELMDELREKLAQKDFDIAMTYFYTESYQAANIAFGNLLKTYPNSKLRENTMFNMIKNMYLYALNSIDSKKIERLYQCIDLANLFKASYNSSTNIKNADRYILLSNQMLEKIKN